MAEDERAYLLRCYEEQICPHCKSTLAETGRYGPGRREDGVFCSMNCYALYNKRELVERHIERLKKARREHNE